MVNLWREGGVIGCKRVQPMIKRPFSCEAAKTAVFAIFIGKPNKR
jgi:hypothetical protein